jgi:hypothetical protein
MRVCPKCKSDTVHLSRTKSKWEVWRKELTAKRPYRCSACGWREWRAWTPDSEWQFSFDSRAVGTDPPSLKQAVLARAEWRPQDLDLSKLDEAIPMLTAIPDRSVSTHASHCTARPRGVERD